MTTRSVVRNAVRSAVYSAVRPASRYIHTLDAAGGMYYDFSSDIAPSGDFVATYIGTLESVVNPILGNTTDANRFVFAANGDVNISFNGTASNLVGVASSYLDGKIHTVVLSKTGSTVEVKVDGTSLGTTTNAGTPTFAFVGRSNATYYDGSILDLKVWDAGTLVLDVDFNTTLASATVPDRSASGNDLTATNMTSADSEYFTKVDGGWNNAFWPNWLQYSDKFDNAAWTAVYAVAELAAVQPPSGFSTAYLLKESTANNNHYIQQPRPIEANSEAFGFAVAKAATRSIMRLRIGEKPGTGPRAWFNLDTGAVDQEDISGSAAIYPLTGGWYLCSIYTPDVKTGGSLPVFQVFIQTAAGQTTYLGDGVSGIHIAAAQFADRVTLNYRKTTSTPGRRLEYA